ncbi:MAG: helix-turn-helix domain-containing protein [Deltaproteobacteria bacterium]|nr:helix-turn-helix domain-containing protein [Deltaproteobacteria bacterium]
MRQACLLLMLAEGQSYHAIRQALGCNANYISRWKTRFKIERQDTN